MLVFEALNVFSHKIHKDNLNLIVCIGLEYNS